MKKYVLPLLLMIVACNKHDQDCYPQRCHITKLTNSDPLYGNYTAIFSYDANGTPLRITRDRPITGSPNYIFRHDLHNRVTDVIGPYDAGNNGDVFEFWYRLKYDNRNRVIQDSSFYFGIIGPNPENFEEHAYTIEVTTYTYDSQNRVIKTEEFQEGYAPDQHFYYYNNSGNLDSVVSKNGNDGSSYTTAYPHYDNKINFRRTNTLWQLLDRNYSVNNELNAVAYNRLGLPTRIEEYVSHYSRQSFLRFLLGNVDVEYSCK